MPLHLTRVFLKKKQGSQQICGSGKRDPKEPGKSMNQAGDTVSGVHFRTGAWRLRDPAKTVPSKYFLQEGHKLQNAQETKHRGSMGSQKRREAMKATTANSSEHGRGTRRAANTSGN